MKIKLVYLLCKTHIIEYHVICFHRYAGRATSSSAATGSKMQHLKELKALLDESLSV